jgi:hypothetical protein
MRRKASMKQKEYLRQKGRVIALNLDRCMKRHGVYDGSNLGRAANVSQETVGKILSGKVACLDVYFRLSKALGIEISKLIPEKP